MKGHRQTTDGVGYETEYAYNLSGAMVEQRYPSGRVVKNVLDASGDLSMVQSARCMDAAAGTDAECTAQAGLWNYAKNFTYNPAGAVTSMQLGNGRWESTAFNSRLQPTQIALGATPNATNLLKLDYSYGSTANNGNVLSQTITVPSVTIGGTTHNGFTAVQNYAYDALNRLDDAAEYIDGSPTPSWRQDFTFDRYGNRSFAEGNTTFEGFEKLCASGTELCAELRKVLNPSANASDNRLSSSDGYVFDPAGNTIRDPQSRRFTYDGENKQVKVETLDLNGNPVSTVGEYEYDGDGKRVKKHVPATGEVTVFVYDAGGKLIGEYSTVAAPQSPKVSYTTADHLGSPRILTDENGATISRRDFMPYGEEIATPERHPNLSYTAADVRQKFTGYERDTETALDFAQARYFNSGFGRFSSPDDFLNDTHVNDPQSWNLYVYVRNNPLYFVDPDGEVKRDADGNVITVERKDKDRNTKTINGKTYYVYPGKVDGKQIVWEVKKVWIYGDNDKDNKNGIKAYEVVGDAQILEKKKDDNGRNFDSLVGVEETKEILGGTALNKTNCHGTTFASGQVWIENDQVTKLMKYDGFRPLGTNERAEVNDVGVYRTDEYINEHSVRVNSVNDKGVVNVISKGGIQPQFILPPGPGKNTAWTDPVSRIEYFTQRAKPKKR